MSHLRPALLPLLYAAERVLVRADDARLLRLDGLRSLHLQHDREGLKREV